MMQPGTHRDNATLCSHAADVQAFEDLRRLLRELPDRAPHLLQELGIPGAAYPDLLKMVVESMRGAQAADEKAKRRFISAVLNHMRDIGTITTWESITSGGRQDYRLELPNHQSVCIEAKGCGDGNNITIWDRPVWADEFIIWSLCPDSLQHQPGHGVWSAISTRLATKIIHEKQRVDAFVYYDQRCGSDLRPCPKAFGVMGLRQNATDILGQDASASPQGGFGLDWLPPPSIYLFPRTVPQAPGNPSPPPHTVESCQFAAALLRAFNVPEGAMPDIVHRVYIAVELRPSGVYRRVAIHHGRNPSPAVQSKWQRLKRS